MVPIACNSCGKKYRISMSYSGKRLRCKVCGQSITVRASDAGPVPWDDAEIDNLSVAPLVTEVCADRGNSLSDSERRLIRIGFVVAIAVVMVLVAFLTIPSQVQNFRSKRSLVEVQGKIDPLLTRARREAASFAWPSAVSSIRQSREILADYRQLLPHHADQLRDRIDETQSEIRKSENDYRRKLDSGYVVTDGRLVSPEEQKEVAAKLERERQDQLAQLEQQRQQGTERAAATAKDAQPAFSTAQPAPPNTVSPEWRRHLESLAGFVVRLDEIMAAIEKPDGIRHDELVTFSAELEGLAEKIYVLDGNAGMSFTAIRAKNVAKEFQIAAAAWDVANAAAKTGPADPSYDFKIGLAKQKIQERDKYTAVGLREGHAFTTAVRAIARDAQVQIPAVKPREVADDAGEVTETQITLYRWRRLAEKDKEIEPVKKLWDGLPSEARKPGSALSARLTKLTEERAAIADMPADAVKRAILAEREQAAQAERQQAAAAKEQQKHALKAEQAQRQWEARVAEFQKAYGNIEFTLCPQCIGPQISAIGSGVRNGTRVVDGKRLPPRDDCRICGGTGLVPAR